MPEEKFKLPLSSYEELTKIIKAYGNLTKPASLEEVSKLIGLHKTVISKNAGFLTATGILEAGAKKQTTSDGKELAQALEHDMSSMIVSGWQQVVWGSDFLSKLLTAITIRNGMDEDTLEAHIAYSAGQPKKAQFMTGARTVVEILRTAELIKEIDGKITANTDMGVAAGMGSDQSEDDNLLEEKPKPAQIVEHGISKQAGITVNIHININCSPDDLEELGSKLKSVIEEITTDEQIDKIDL